MGHKRVALCDGPHCAITKDIDEKRDPGGWPDEWIVIDVKRARDVSPIHGMRVITTGEHVFHSAVCLARYVALWNGTPVPDGRDITVTYRTVT